MDPQTVPPIPRRLRLPLLAAFVTVALAGIVLLLAGPWRPSGKQPPKAEAADPLPLDPRLAYMGPFRNLHPDVKYVGSAACANCHFKEDATYRKHPMGRSLLPISQAVAPPTDARHHNPFDALGLRFRVDRADGRVWHRQSRLDEAGKPLTQLDLEVHYVIGSGERGHSYLTERDGYLFQTPISWYGQKQIWDLSPGFNTAVVGGRRIGTACLFCHANQTVPHEGTFNRYDPPVFRGHAIGCERCHGPGEKHVASADALDIVRPSKLAPALREAVCQQCHLEGEARITRRGLHEEDFRPGLPLEEFLFVLVHDERGEHRKAVNHVEQMYESRCFLKSTDDKKLGCISCHNPHEKPTAAERVGYFRGRCLECHTKHSPGCSAPLAVRLKASKEDSCIACHMPRYSAADIVHTAATDHRIPRRPGQEEGPGPAVPPAGPDELPIRDFFRGRLNLNDLETIRAAGLGLVQLIQHRKLNPVPHGRTAVGLLEQTLANSPGDAHAWYVKGSALLGQRRLREGLACLKTSLAKAPDRELVLVAAGQAAQELEKYDEAADYWGRAVKINPWMPLYRNRLCIALASKEAWDEVRPHCRAWKGLAPTSAEARMMWITCLIKAGDRAEARREFDRLLELRPPNVQELRSWFASQ